MTMPLVRVGRLRFGGWGARKAAGDSSEWSSVSTSQRSVVAARV